MRLLYAFLLSVTVCGAHAQDSATSQKIGHADWEYIFSQLPEYKQIESELGTFENQLQSHLKIKSQKLESKYKAYQALPADSPEAIRNDKESELSFLQQNIEQFQRDAQASMQKKQTALVNPVFAKVGKAIEEVAVENSYSYIINPQMIGGGDILLFTDEKYNISDLVLKKPGIDVKESTSGKGD